MSLHDALARTLLLMRDEVREDTSDETILAALTSTRVALVADEKNLITHAAQTAFVTAAMLMARSGHKVYLLAPNVALSGTQLPLRHGNLLDELVSLGRDMLPGVFFETKLNGEDVDLAVGIGNTPVTIPAARRVWISAEPWSGSIMREEKVARWRPGSWPMGGMTAGALAAGEAFKAAMHRLRPYVRSIERLDTVFAYTDAVTFNLAPPETPFWRNLGDFDFISGGAITNAALFALSRIPGVNGQGRVIDDDTAAISNLNRYMLLCRTRLGEAKADDLELLFPGALRIKGLTKRFGHALRDEIAPLAPSVLVGVDHIPTRWAAQEAGPGWLGIGATTHWSAMASYHSEGLGCARCLHAEDDPDEADIPTVAFVSFWAGLFLATYFLRHLAGASASDREQQIYMTPVRAENPMRSPVPHRLGCQTCAVIMRQENAD